MLKLCCCAVVSLCALFPANLMAGGPPRLCLPIDGVTPGNVQTCGELLSKNLASKLWAHSDPPERIRLVQRGEQWYLTFHMGREVALSEVEAALKGSDCSIPREKLRFFGHVTLHFETRGATQERLIADLEQIDNLALDESKAENNLLSQVVEIPYPVDRARKDDALDWESFQRNFFNDNLPEKSSTPIPAKKLPSYEMVRTAASRNDVSLKDVVWSPHYACRALGAVASPGAKTKST